MPTDTFFGFKVSSVDDRNKATVDDRNKAAVDDRNKFARPPFEFALTPTLGHHVGDPPRQPTGEVA